MEKTSRWWQDTKESVKTAVEKTQNFVEKIGNSIKEGLNDCATKVKEGLKVLTEGAKGVWNAVTNFVEEHPFLCTAILIVGLAALTAFTGGAASAILLAATKGAIMGAVSGFGTGVVTAGIKRLIYGDSYSFDDAVHDVGKSTFGGALSGAITGGAVEAGKQLWSKVGGKITDALGKRLNKDGSWYYQDANGRWHRPNGQFASNAEMGIETPVKASTGTHGNSLSDPRTNYGYTLVDKDTNEILKFGETLYPDSRYSQNFLNENNAEMKILEQGSKSYIHNWQHNLNMYFKYKYGEFPPLNKGGW